MNIHLKWKIIRIIITTLYLFLFWLLFSWNLAPTSLVLGFIFSISIAFLTYDLFIETHEAHRRGLVPRIELFLIYCIVLLIKVYAASFKIIPKIFTRNINPKIVYFRTRLKSDLARVILANSITFTPGTLTVDLDEDLLLVHWLNAKTTHSHHAGELIKGHLEAWLRRVFV